MYRRNLVWPICIRRNAYAPFRLRSRARPSGPKHTHCESVPIVPRESVKTQTPSNESREQRLRVEEANAIPRLADNEVSTRLTIHAMASFA